MREQGNRNIHGGDSMEQAELQRSHIAKRKVNTERRAQLRGRIAGKRAELTRVQRSAPEGNEILQRLYNEIDAAAAQYEGRMKMKSNRVTALNLGDPGALHFYLGDILRAGVDRLWGSSPGIGDVERAGAISALNQEIAALEHELAGLGTV